MAVEQIEGPEDGETVTEWLERMVGRPLSRQILRCLSFEDFCTKYPEGRKALARRGRTKLVEGLYADGTIESIAPPPTNHRREIIGKLTLDLAAQCKDFAEFRRKHPHHYTSLLRRGFSKNLYQMFEDGTIHSMIEEPPPRLDMRRKENRVTPLIKRAQVRTHAKRFHAFEKFMRDGGQYAEAAKRLGMEEELRQYFARPLHASEIFDEAELFPDWRTFENERPRHADDAVNLKMKNTIVNHIAKAVFAKGGKKKK